MLLLQSLKIYDFLLIGILFNTVMQNAPKYRDVNYHHHHHYQYSGNGIHPSQLPTAYSIYAASSSCGGQARSVLSPPLSVPTSVSPSVNYPTLTDIYHYQQNLALPISYQQDQQCQSAPQTDLPQPQIQLNQHNYINIQYNCKINNFVEVETGSFGNVAQPPPAYYNYQYNDSGYFYNYDYEPKCALYAQDNQIAAYEKGEDYSGLVDPQLEQQQLYQTLLHQAPGVAASYLPEQVLPDKLDTVFDGLDAQKKFKIELDQRHIDLKFEQADEQTIMLKDKCGKFKKECRRFKDLLEPSIDLSQPNVTTIMQRPVDMGETKRYKRKNYEDLEKRRTYECKYDGNLCKYS